MFTKNKSKIFREKLESGELVRIVGAHDGLGAKLIAEANFDAVWASGLEISASHGLPDANILTMTEYLERASEMNDASQLPVVADCDTGYGNVNNVIHLVEKYEKRGIAGICIEDKLFPKTNSFVDGRQDLASVDEFCGKIRAAKDTQKTKDFIVIARVEALIAGWGMEEALLRANSYADSGADLILIHSKKKEPKEIIEFCKKFKNKIPVIVVPTTYPYFNEKQMEQLKIKAVIYANHVLRSTIQGVSETLKILRKKRQLSYIEKRIAPLKKVFDMQGVDILKDNEKNYLPKKNSDIKTIVLAAGAPPKSKSHIKKTDEFIFKNYPVSLLKINNKTILERIIESCKKASLSNIEVVTGYKSESFPSLAKVNFIKNKRYKNTTQLESASIVLDEKFKTLIIYGDLIFEPDIVNRLVSLDEDVIIAISSKSTETSPYADIAFTEKKNPKEGRILTLHRKFSIEKLAKDPKNTNFNFEFIGISFFSKKVTKELLKITRQNKNIDFNDAINILIKRNFKVVGIEVSSGWSEIRNKTQFNLASNFFK